MKRLGRPLVAQEQQLWHTRVGTIEIRILQETRLEGDIADIRTKFHVKSPFIINLPCLISHHLYKLCWAKAYRH